MNKILDFLNKEMNKPIPYSSFSQSWFQYLALIIFIVGLIVALVKMRNLNDKKINKILISSSVLLLILETYKQIIFSYQSNWSYQWYAFPFQFCSVPMYIGLIVPLANNKKTRDSLITFLATFSFFSGFAVMVYPATVFTATIGINIQTMVHHGLIAIIGLGLLVYQTKNNYKPFLGSIVIFAILIIIAIVLNSIHNKWILNGSFNMFFINPKYDNGLPILQTIQPHVGPIIFVLIYFLGFSFVSLLIFNTKLNISRITNFKQGNITKCFN